MHVQPGESGELDNGSGFCGFRPFILTETKRGSPRVGRSLVGCRKFGVFFFFSLFGNEG